MATEQVNEGTSLVEQQRDVARSRILTAARRALAARGLSTTVDEVAEVAGVSRRTVFRHFATRERLFAAAITDSIRAYAEHIPSADERDAGDWLPELMHAAHKVNARNGRIYWELAALEPELTGELAVAAAERREARQRFAAGTTRRLWRSRGGEGDPPEWLADAVAVHLSGFATQALAGDFDRTPEQVAEVSTQVITAALDAALARPR